MDLIEIAGFMYKCKEAEFIVSLFLAVHVSHTQVRMIRTNPDHLLT